MANQTLRYQSNRRYIAAGADWLLDLTPATRGAVWSDAATIIRDFVASKAGAEAVAPAHQNQLALADFRGGQIADELRGRRRGSIFVVDTAAKRWYGGPYDTGSDDETVPTNALISRPFTLVQSGGPWLDGATRQGLVRVVPFTLTNAAASLADVGGIDTGNDRAIALLTTSAEAQLHLDGAAASDQVATPAAEGWVELTNLAALGNGVVADADLVATGLTGQETLTGWLLVGRNQKRD